MGYDFTEDEKVPLRKRFKSAIGSSIESFDVFVEQALLNLHQNAFSFCLPEAFLNVRLICLYVTVNKQQFYPVH